MEAASGKFLSSNHFKITPGKQKNAQFDIPTSSHAVWTMILMILYGYVHDHPAFRVHTPSPRCILFYMNCMKNRGGRWPRFATERSVKKHYILLFRQNMESPFSTACRATAGGWNICAHADMKGVVLHAKI